MNPEDKSAENDNVMTNDSRDIPEPAEQSSFANLLPELRSREAAIARHCVALDRETHQAAIGEELLSINERKLYKAAGFKSLHAYLATLRNRLSRSRAYQLMDFAQTRRLALREGRPLPENERQTRMLKPQSQQCDAFEQRWRRVFRYLDKEFRSCSSAERPRFIEAMEATASHFTHVARAEIAPAPPDTSVPGKQMPDGQLCPSRPAPVTHAGGSSATSPNPGASQQPVMPGTTTERLSAEPAVTVGGANVGWLQGMSMDEARRRGYVH